MKHRHNLLALLAAAALLASLPTACVDEETDLGLALTDPSSHFNAKHDTLYPDFAYSFRDTNLVTCDQNYNIVGNYSDPISGRVEAELFTQLSLPSNTSTLDFDSIVIDSVVLTLVKHQLFPDSNATLNLLFEVSQLSEPVLDTVKYKASDSLPVVEGSPLHLDRHYVGPASSEIRLPLSGNVMQMLDFSGDNADFKRHAKGLRIRIVAGLNDDGMATFDFAATKTRLTAFYHHQTNRNDTASYHFSLSHPFMHFRHNYAGTALGADSIDGSNTLYLEPLAGYNVRICIDSALAAFRSAHPTAVIHQAELLLSVDPSSPALRPSKLVATTLNPATGKEVFVPDYLISAQLSSLNDADNTFCLSLPRHLQSMLRSGSDNGTIVTLDQRRYQAPRIFFLGTASASRPRFAITYSE